MLCILTIEINSKSLCFSGSGATTGNLCQDKEDKTKTSNINGLIH